MCVYAQIIGGFKDEGQYHTIDLIRMLPSGEAAEVSVDHVEVRTAHADERRETLTPNFFALPEHLSFWRQPAVKTQHRSLSLSLSLTQTHPPLFFYCVCVYLSLSPPIFLTHAHLCTHTFFKKRNPAVTRCCVAAGEDREGEGETERQNERKKERKSRRGWECGRESIR